MPTLRTLRISRAAWYQPLPDAAPVLEKRNRLAELLAEAAEFEHNVLCQYLFAACSLKRHPDEGGVTWAQLECMRRWEAAILQVARQEMEHLGLVNNMLTAIGEAPHFSRPNYPFASPYSSVDVPFTLTPFSRETLLRFICFEMPLKPPADIVAKLGKHIHGFTPGNFDGLAQLYGEIRALFTEIDESILFVGPPSAQFNTLQIIPGTSIRGIPLRASTPRYNVMMLPVNDRQSAQCTVDQIVGEGEGGPGEPLASSHFMMFLNVWQELENELKDHPKFEPARNVGPNPILKGEEGVRSKEPTTMVDDPAAVLLSQLFDASYSTMLLILLRYFTHTDETQAQLDALEQAAFFPLMTAVIRPVAELLTQFPASAGEPAVKAGPAFRFGHRIAFLPHKHAAWKVIAMQLQRMTDLASKARAIPCLPEAMSRRLDTIYQNIARIGMVFEDNMQVRPVNE